MFPVAGKVLTLPQPIALVLTRCTKPSFSSTIVCVCIHTCSLLSPSFPCLTHCNISLLPPPSFSFQSLEANSTLGVILKWGKILGCSKHCCRLANPLQSKEQWGQVSCGNDKILFTHLSTVGFPHQQDLFPGLFSSFWVYGLEVEWLLVTLGSVMWYLLTLSETWSAADNSGTAQNILR